MLRNIAKDLWDAEFDLFMGGVVHFRGRMTVIRLSDGGLMLHSPIPIDDAMAGALDELGPVAHLVAPNLFHHVHLAGVMARYPNAKLWGPPGLDEKRKDLRIDAQLGTEAPEAWSGDLDQLRIAGMPKLAEHVFLHRASRTLIVTDLVFNIEQCRGWITKLVLRMAGAYRGVAQSRMLRVLTQDRDAAGRSVNTMLAWEFDRVLMAHGRPLDQDARALLTQATWWMRRSKNLAPAAA